MTPRAPIVVLGMMTKMPVAGVVWQTVHYLVGFQRLGYDVYYVEAHARTPSMLMEKQDDDGSARAAAFIADALSPFDLGDRWAFHALHHDGQCYGLSERRLAALYRNAALIVNLHGGTEPLPAHSQSGRLVYLETDPVQLQVELHDGLQSTVDFLEPHCAFFTFAENLGAADCRLPVTDRYRFQPTRQPVVVDFWANDPAHARPVFTTIGNWQQSWRSVELDGETYQWSKHHEFRKFLDVPARTGKRFELALSSIDDDDRQLLDEHGWGVRRALDFSMDVDAYRKYIAGSRAEFTVAKDQNVRLRTGWFSDRSATYLAAGRPVVTQDTGFDCALPVGDGLFAFTSIEEIEDAVQRIESDYRAQRRSARAIAREHFDATRVLGRLLDDVGLEAAGSASKLSSRTSVVTPIAPTVGVVIPCFNLGEFLPEAVESVLAQTRPADELFIVDDGSTDPTTCELLDRYARDGVTVLRTEHRGASAARNHGIAAARAEYMVCLDADDVLLPTFLERTVARLDATPGAGIATTHVEFFGDRQGIWETPDYAPTLLLWENCIASASLFRMTSWRDAGGYADLEACQDWDLWLSMVERGWRWTCVPEVLYRYRVRSGSITDRTRELRPELLRTLVGRHSDTYRKNLADVVVAMDSEVGGLRETTRRYEQDLRAKDAQILALRESIEGPRRPIHADGDGSHAVPDEGPFARLAGIAASIEAPEAKLAGASPDEQGALCLTVLGGDAEGRSKATPAEVDRLREAGTEFLLIPPEVRPLVETDLELLRHLELTYYAVVRDEEDGLLFDLREQLERPTFTVAICTFRRPDLLQGALDSVLDQDYPTDRFEVIVVDNEPSEAARAVAETASGGPVPVSYYVAEHNGLSFARNAAVCRSRGEYVAFLDDDAVAGRHWLSAFASVINQYGALAVGGRVEAMWANGASEPRWLQQQYVRGFFGLNYRDWGKPERVFRIRRPLYLGGGNSAYARRLFRHFGLFRPELGRTGSALLAAEETLFNALLERSDIPLYYSDDAVVEHVIARSRMTRHHLRRKAYCAGVSDATLERLLDGSLTHSTMSSWGEVAGRLAALARRGGRPGFVAELKLARSLGYAARVSRMALAKKLGQPAERSVEVSWTLEHWLAEVLRWPEGRERYRELANVLLALGQDGEAREALSRLDTFQDVPANVDRTLKSRRLLHSQYERMVRDVQRTLETTLPPESRILVATRGDERLVTLAGHVGWHFPQNAQGVYAGYYPEDSEDAIAQLEGLRGRGADFLVFPLTSLWWLEHYRGFARHLEERYTVVRRGELCTIFSLATPLPLAESADPVVGQIAITA